MLFRWAMDICCRTVQDLGGLCDVGYEYHLHRTESISAIPPTVTLDNLIEDNHREWKQFLNYIKTAAYITNFVPLP